MAGAPSPVRLERRGLNDMCVLYSPYRHGIVILKSFQTRTLRNICSADTHGFGVVHPGSGRGSLSVTLGRDLGIRGSRRVGYGHTD